MRVCRLRHVRGFAASARLLNSKRLEKPEDIQKFLARPSWSVSSLLPDKSGQTGTPDVTSKQLHHLLRLSALPPPKDDTEEAEMLKTLSDQLHFVKNVQKIDTNGVDPLYSLRDETAAGREEATIDIAAMQHVFDQEEVVGKHHKRIRRKSVQASERTFQKWDVLGTADKTVGRYFVVEGGKD